MGWIQELADLAPSNQTEGFLLRTMWPAKLAGKIQQKASSVNSLRWKNTLSYF